MPYNSKSELPENVKENLPEHAEEIYKEAFNSAWEQYDKKEERKGGRSREETAHAIAWSAVKRKYEKIDGDWKKKRGD